MKRGETICCKHAKGACLENGKEGPVCDTDDIGKQEEQIRILKTAKNAWESFLAN